MVGLGPEIVLTPKSQSSICIKNLVSLNSKNMHLLDIICQESLQGANDNISLGKTEGPSSNLQNLFK